MSISSEITRISNAKTAISESIANKGVTVPSGTKIDGMAALIDSIQTGGGGGDTSETWVIKSDAAGEFATTQIAFTSNGQKFTSIGTNRDYGPIVLYYDNTEIAGYEPGTETRYTFNNEAYRKLTFDTPPTGALLTWLQSNAVKQTSDTAVQPSKALTVTSNGTTTITPDAPYDAIKQVDVTVDVDAASVSTVTINCESNDSFALWLSTDGVFHKTLLNAGANTIIVNPYSPIGVFNTFGYTLTNLNNIVNSGSYIIASTDDYGGNFGKFTIYYATSITASATQPTD